MPFNPKRNQLYHLILCSNYEVGVKATRNFYCEKANNPEYKPDNRKAFDKFKQVHPDTFQGLSGNQRPKQWLILWKIITEHEEGICDYLCRDFEKIEPEETKRNLLIDWLEQNGYLIIYDIDNAWGVKVKQYRLDWPNLKEKLGIEQPSELRPLSLKPQSVEEINQ